MVLVPVLDILQSLPIFGFLTFTVTFFLGLFPGQVIGAELAVVFVIFTSQAWNMAFSVYQSLRTIPSDLDEASRGFRLSPWQRFWRLEVPFAMPGLVWNMMMSMSGGWFMPGGRRGGHRRQYHLPAARHRQLHRRRTGARATSMRGAVYAILAMLVVILAYDQLLFRPLGRLERQVPLRDHPGGPGPRPVDAGAAAPHAPAAPGRRRAGRRVPRADRPAPLAPPRGTGAEQERPSRGTDLVFGAAVAVVVAWAAWRVVAFCAAAHLTFGDLGSAFVLGLYTLVRVMILMSLATLVWVPLGVLIGLNPRWSRVMGGAAQFLAAFPANLFYPIFVVVIVRHALNPDVWLTPLIILGTQWYIAFNVIAGAAAYPGDLQEAAKNFRVGGLLWWRRVILPGIFPYFVTGAITASGGCWNASLLAEVASWGSTTIRARGLGAYIQDATTRGDTARVLLGMVVMAGFVLTFNRLVWRPMYAYSSKRLRL